MTNGIHESGSCSSGDDLLQRIARGDLSLPPLVDARTGRRRERGPARGGAVGLQHFQARTIERLERQLELEPRLGRGVERAGSGDCFLPVEFSAVATEAQRAGAPLVARRRASAQ
ncbi:MAG: hypothetical protein DMG01_29770 [Acidobacteria bacterium]|nr:MAG: hypothetical protein DMG01_29770 [Acidobacteriota bacterium]